MGMPAACRDFCSSSWGYLHPVVVLQLAGMFAERGDAHNMRECLQHMGMLVVHRNVCVCGMQGCLQRSAGPTGARSSSSALPLPRASVSPPQEQAQRWSCGTELSAACFQTRSVCKAGEGCEQQQRELWNLFSKVLTWALQSLFSPAHPRAAVELALPFSPLQHSEGLLLARCDKERFG